MKYTWFPVGNGASEVYSTSKYPYVGLVFKRFRTNEWVFCASKNADVLPIVVEGKDIKLCHILDKASEMLNDFLQRKV